MSTHADIAVENGVAHIAPRSGPAARLTADVLRQMDEALSTAETDDAVNIVVLASKAGAFPSGLTEPQAGGDDHDTRLADLCTRIEGFPIPVIAVLTGAVVGGGAEIALACHYRLADRAARIGFPNARLGLVPSAGATQRLPRLLGAGATLDLLLGGQLQSITSQGIEPLVDHLFDGPRYDAIIAFVTTLRKTGAKPRPTGQIRAGFAEAQAYQSAVNDARKSLDPRHDTVAKHILSAVEAALVLPIDAGLAFEQAAAEDSSETPQAKALAHIFHAEQAVASRTRRTDLPEISTIAVLGPGPLAAQIVMSALDVGLQVNWVIKDPVLQRDAVKHVKDMLQDAVLKRKISADYARICEDALRHGDSLQPLGDVDIALRAARGQRGVPVPPDLPLAHCLPGTDPRLAMRFAPLSASTRLVEVIFGPNGSDSDLRAALGLVRHMNTLAVVERTAGPSLHDRLTQALWRGADALVDLGQSPFAIDAAMRDWGMALPPYQLADVAGLDMVARQDRAEGVRNWSAVLTGQGRNGSAAQGGFYTYSGGGTATIDPRVTALLDDMRPAKPDMPHRHVQRLLFGAMANEAARALREGVVQQASDIDIVSIFTGLLPIWSGGILHHASDDGLLQITRAMTDLPHPDRDFWTPDPIFADLIKYGRSFDDR